jgi:DNA-binding MarR family transcriptional regulator
VKLEDAIQTDKFASEKVKAGLNILYTAWWLKSTLSRQLKNIGLTHEQFNVLRILNGKSPIGMCVRDIGSRMIEQSSNVPRIIDRLIIKNYVAKAISDADKRETVITLTTDGLNILTVANKKVNKVIAKSIKVEEEQAEKLNELLELFRQEE